MRNFKTDASGFFAALPIDINIVTRRTSSCANNEQFAREANGSRDRSHVRRHTTVSLRQPREHAANRAKSGEFTAGD